MFAGPLSVFAHLNAEKTLLYRRILRAFAEARERFSLHLRPHDVVVALSRAGEPVALDEAEGALSQLREWRNLEAHRDNADVATVRDYYRSRFLYRLSAAGEAAERAIETFETALRATGELQTAALSDIRLFLTELEQVAAEDPLDEGKAHRILRELRARFDELTSRAHAFIGSLQRTIQLQTLEAEALLEYKNRLIEYLERFIGELVIARSQIAEQLERIDRLGVDRLLSAAVRRDLVDALEPAGEATDADARAHWESRWAGLRSWFTSGRDGRAQAEVLRSFALTAISTLLGAVAGLNDRRLRRSDRFTDFRTLAVWFARLDDDLPAHRLWRAAFGLAPARHLTINAETFLDRGAHPIPPQTSWLDAPPIRVSAQLRRTGSYKRRGKPAAVIDRKAAKLMLQREAEAEAAQILAAQRRFATGIPMRLSSLGELNPVEFRLFLELLGQALASKFDSTSTVEVPSTDGTLLLTLSPCEGRATIPTDAGELSGPDHLLTVRSAVESA